MRRALAIALVIAAAAPAPSRAAPPPRCKIDANAALAFGAYDPLSGAPTDALTTIGYDCMTTPGPLILLSAGNSGTFAARALQQGTYVLAYNVFTDAARTRVLGDGTGSSVTIDGTNARKQTLPIHGRIFAGQFVPAGAYGDRLVITILF